MRLYITGIVGMLGYHIFKELKDIHIISGVDIADCPMETEYLKCDLTNFEAVKQHIQQFCPDVLIHTAAIINVDWCEENPEEAVLFNTDVTRLLSDLCKEEQIKMIYVSTDAVFDGEKQDLYVETDETNPLNVYAKTKLSGEQFVLESPKNLVFRTNIIGRNKQNKTSFAEWVYNNLSEDNTLNMFTDVFFSPILVNELAWIIHKSIIAELVGLYHVCGSGAITKYAFGTLVKQKSNLHTGQICPSSVKDMKFKAKRANHMGLSNEKITNVLSISISTPEQTVTKFLDTMGDTAWR